MTRRMRERLLTIPEVKTVISKTGRPEDGTDPEAHQHGGDPRRPQAANAVAAAA